MVKRILREDIWRRLTSRFKATITVEKEQPTLLEEVQPITNIDELLKELKFETDATHSTNPAIGYQQISAVPEGKRWRIKRIEYYRNGTVAEFTDLGIQTLAMSAVEAISEQVTAGAWIVLLEGINFPDELWLPQSTTIHAYMSTREAAQTFTHKVFYIEEDAF